MPARPLFIQLSCSICWTVKFTFVLFQPTYTMQVYEVGATKLQCLLLSDIEITQQSYGKTLWQSIPTVLRHVHKHLLLTFQNHPHSLHTAPWEVLGWVWMVRGFFIFQTLCIRSHYSSRLKSIWLTFWITSWKTKQFSKEPHELFKENCNFIHQKS